MKTCSSKSIGGCLCTLALAAVGALCALLAAGVYAEYGWDISGTEGLVKLGFVIAALLVAALLGLVVRRTCRQIRYSLIMRRRNVMFN